MARITKDQIISEFITIIKEYRTINNQLLKLANAGKISTGALRLHLSHHNHHYKWFIDGRKMEEREKNKTKLFQYKYHLDELKKSLQIAKDFIATDEQG